jgi:arginase family enzyme
MGGRCPGSPVSPPYDHAELTALAAANVAYEMLSLFARGPK